MTLTSLLDDTTNTFNQLSRDVYASTFPQYKGEIVDVTYPTWRFIEMACQAANSFPLSSPWRPIP